MALAKLSLAGMAAFGWFAGSLTRSVLVELATMAEKAERYEDMVVFIKRVVEIGGEVSLEERNLLSVAYKNIIGEKRAAWRALSAIEAKVPENSPRWQLAREYRQKVEGEIERACSEVLKLLEDHLIPSAQDPESRLFYLKMKGDFYRYRADHTRGEQHALYLETSKAAYDQAFQTSRFELHSAHPIPLGLSLSYAVFSYEILNEPERACELARSAFDTAMSELDTLPAEHMKDSALILQLLRDNLTRWTAEEK